MKELLYLSCAGPQASVKALRGVLYTPKMNFELQVDWDGNWQSGIGQGTAFERGGHGYEVFTHSLGFNTYHLVAISKRPGFLTTMDDEAVWQQLCDPRFTTPILREWSGYIKAEMVRREQIIKAPSYGCQCAYMIGTDEQLDEIVEKGLRSGRLKIG